MDTISITEFINLHQRQNVFKGVFPCDFLPVRFGLPAVFVINLSLHNEPGTHWVAVYISKESNAYYFDSFGLKPTNSYIVAFLKSHARNVTYNKKQVQHVTSNKCGRFCCVFAVLALRNSSIDSFIRRFGINLYINDFIIENMYNFLKMK